MKQALELMHAVLPPAGRGALMDGIRTALLAFSLVAALFLLQGKILINLADEGFLWYGTLRTACGELPLRDFQSYYPGTCGVRDGS